MSFPKKLDSKVKGLDMSLEENRLKAAAFFYPIEDKWQLRDWVKTFVNIDLPFDTIDPDSNSNPLDAMWAVYDAVKNNRGDEIPGFILLSAREGYKTLTASILEVLLLFHFEASVAHMAAIQKQSDKAISYINKFINVLEPVWSYHKWSKISDSKSKIQFRTPKNEEPYITVIICSMAGANSEHVPLMFIDEIDVVRDPRAYEEAKLIPGMDRGRYPITVKLSTRKFAFGMMSQEVENAPRTGEKIQKWNILDVTAKCEKSRNLRNDDDSRIERYVARSLPFRQATPEEFEELPESKKDQWEKVMAHPGCLKCPLLPVCKTRLADKPDDAKRGLYKPIPAIIRSFSQVSPDMAEAQLMCWKPSARGLVYPRFEPTHGGNLISIDAAYELLTDDKQTGVSLEALLEEIKRRGCKVFAGIDWGYTHEFTIVVIAVLPNGYSLLLDSFGSPGLELDDMIIEAQKRKEKFGVQKWFCDQAMPSNIKTFNKKGLTSPDFTKDIMAGIEGIRGQVVDTMGKRRLRVVDTDDTQKCIQGFKVHHFKLDAAGNPTRHPDDEEFADVMDALRYIGQNIYMGRGNTVTFGTSNDPLQPKYMKKDTSSAENLNKDLMKEKISTLVAEGDGATTKKKGSFRWNI